MSVSLFPQLPSSCPMDSQSKWLSGAAKLKVSNVDFHSETNLVLANDECPLCQQQKNNDTIPDTGLLPHGRGQQFILPRLYPRYGSVFPVLGISVKTRIRELAECLSSSSWYSIQHCL